MLYNTKTKCFTITKETLQKFMDRERSLVNEDLKNHLYTTSEIFKYVHSNQLQHILEKAKSLSYRTLLFQYYTGKSLSVLQAIGLSTMELNDTYSSALEDSAAIIINQNGGYTPISDIDTTDLVEYSFELDNLTDNNTMNLVIENDKEPSKKLLGLIDSYFEPSVITNYKHIAKYSKINDFILSRNDWTLWIETQGMDINLYKMFLTNYQNNIEQIFVLTSNDKILSELSAEFPNIELKKI